MGPEPGLRRCTCGVGNPHDPWDGTLPFTNRAVAEVCDAPVKLGIDFEVKPLWLNGAPAARIDVDGELYGVVNLVIDDGRITRLYAVANPHKLTRLDQETELSR